MTCSVNGPTSDINDSEKHRAQPQAIQPHKSRPYKSQRCKNRQNSGRQQGFTLIELMVATVLSLWVVTAATNMAISAINNQRQLDAAREVEQTGAYLSQHLQRQLSMAGFFGPLDVALPQPSASFTPTVCTASPGSDDLAVPVRGQKNDADDFKLICVGDSDDHTVLSGTHVLTLMRASTETIASASLDSDTYYIQSNHRKLEVDLGSNSSSFDLTNINGNTSDIREYVSYVYFVDQSNTFRRLRYKPGGFTSEPLANNVTDFQVNYYITPNVSLISSGSTPTGYDDVVAVKAVVSVENTVDTTIKQFSVFSMLYNPSLRRLSEVLTNELE